jgi:heme/copper-type cytochrome/quinol oxidase subunit 3
MSAPVTEPLYPTTGEPVSINARRNHMGIWLCIVSDITGTVALLVAYSYLWSLNVNNAWAPPNDAWAPPMPFWLIVLGAAVATALMWWGLRLIDQGNRRGLMLAASLSMLIILITFIGQIVQLSTFPFGPSNGAYASATFWLCIGSAIHLSLVLFLTQAIMGRTRAGRITPGNSSHVRLVAMYMTWAAIAILLGAMFATVMTTSPNTNSPTFGTFQG